MAGVVGASKIGSDQARHSPETELLVSLVVAGLGLAGRVGVVLLSGCDSRIAWPPFSGSSRFVVNRSCWVGVHAAVLAALARRIWPDLTRATFRGLVVPQGCDLR